MSDAEPTDMSASGQLCGEIHIKPNLTAGNALLLKKSFFMTRRYQPGKFGKPVVVDSQIMSTVPTSRYSRSYQFAERRDPNSMAGGCSNAVGDDDTLRRRAAVLLVLLSIQYWRKAKDLI